MSRQNLEIKRKPFFVFTLLHYHVILLIITVFCPVIIYHIRRSRYEFKRYQETIEHNANPAQEELFKAIDNNDIETIKKRIATGIDLNQYRDCQIDQHYYCSTPLIAALRGGNHPAAQLLLQSGADGAAVDGLGKTPLHFAAEKGYIDIVTLLLEKYECTLNENYDEFGNTPLHCAAEYGHYEVVQLLIQKGAVVTIVDGTHDDTPLHCAVRSGMRCEYGIPYCFAQSDHYLEIVKLLLNHGAHTNQTNNQGNTPLHCAVEFCKENSDCSDQLILVQYLINNKADKNALNNEGKTPLMLTNCFAVKQLLKEN